MPYTSSCKEGSVCCDNTRVATTQRPRPRPTPPPTTTTHRPFLPTTTQAPDYREECPGSCIVSLLSFTCFREWIEHFWIFYLEKTFFFIWSRSIQLQIVFFFIHSIQLKAMLKWRICSSAKNPEQFAVRLNHGSMKCKAWWCIATIHSQCLLIRKRNSKCHNICQTIIIQMAINNFRPEPMLQFRMHISQYSSKLRFLTIIQFHRQTITSRNRNLCHNSRSSRITMLQCLNKAMRQFRQTIFIHKMWSSPIRMSIQMLI